MSTPTWQVSVRVVFRGIEAATPGQATDKAAELLRAAGAEILEWGLCRDDFFTRKS